MIKAYWPGIEGTIHAIKPRPPETQVALLGTRLSLDLAEGKNTLPAQPFVNSLRQLSTAQAGDSKKAHELVAQREQIRTMFGLPKTEDSNVTLPLFRVALNPRFTRPFYAVPRTSAARTASG